MTIPRVGPDVRLIRQHQDEWGVFGNLYVPGYNLFTCEDDWLENGPGSCIPAGKYKCTRTVYYKYGYETFWIHVPKRVRILFHAGNTENDTRGCVLVGTRMGTLDVEDEDSKRKVKPIVTKTAVVNSRIAFKRFMESLNLYDEFQLSVEWGPGLPKEL